MNMAKRMEQLIDGLQKTERWIGIKKDVGNSFGNTFDERENHRS